MLEDLWPSGRASVKELADRTNEAASIMEEIIEGLPSLEDIKMYEEEEEELDEAGANEEMSSQDLEALMTV